MTTSDLYSSSPGPNLADMIKWSRQALESSADLSRPAGSLKLVGRNFSHRLQAPRHGEKRELANESETTICGDQRRG
jgi:hypothetical protein